MSKFPNRHDSYWVDIERDRRLCANCGWDLVAASMSVYVGKVEYQICTNCAQQVLLSFVDGRIMGMMVRRNWAFSLKRERDLQDKILQTFIITLS